MQTSSRNQQRDIVNEFGQAVLANPVPAALIGAGLIWMLAGGRTRLADVPRVVANGARGGADLGRQGMASAGHAASAVAGSMSDAAHSISDAAHAFGHRDETHLLSAGTEAASSAARHVQNTLADLVARQPLVLGAVGLAIGAGIASAFAGTDFEARFMGATADTARDRAADLAEQAKSKGSQAVSRGLREAQAQGINPAAAGAALREVVEKADAVVSETIDDVADRIKGRRV